MHDRKTDTGDHAFLVVESFHLGFSFKGGSVEETLMYMLPPNSKFEFSFPGFIFCFLRTFLLSFSVTGSQMSQCFAVRTSVVFLAKTKTKAWLSIIWWENSNLLCVENIYTSVSSIRPTLSVKFLN